GGGRGAAVSVADLGARRRSGLSLHDALPILEEGVTTPERRFFDPGYLVVGKHRLRCWKAGGHGSQTFVEAVENSCNPVFATLGIDRKSTRLNSSHVKSSYAVCCSTKKNNDQR